MKDCIFCSKELEVQIQNEKAIAIFDKFPVSKGHILIIPKKHFSDWFNTDIEYKAAMMELLEEAKVMLDSQFAPDGYNIGINCGAVAGQTIMHTHMHLIPRYNNDMEKPEGGVRGVIPHKQKY